MWEIDCIQFWRAGLPFQVRNVVTPEHEKFISDFAASHGLLIERAGPVAVFVFPGAE
ncbi:MAG TPA: hypothetical protein VK633_08550 [Verrucomicrobiae bacterium]|nr:hypothetical protein [Verrucomicrobiae bacterium]